MNERRRPPRRGRGKRPSNPAGAETADNPYREDADGGGAETAVGQSSEHVEAEAPAPRAERPTPPESAPPVPSERTDRDDTATNGGGGRSPNGTSAPRESNTG